MLDPIPISALEHTSYCPRQCALIHVEGIFDENIFTLRGHQVHERVDQAETRSERGKTIIRGLPVWSDAFGITGRCDAVEFDPKAQIYRPIEYKSGKTRAHPHASIQAAAQAMCLEEMFATEVREIVLYFVASKDRIELSLDDELRKRTLDTIVETRRILQSRILPPPVADKRCRNCSLIDACQPFAVSEALGHQANAFRPRPESSQL